MFERGKFFGASRSSRCLSLPAPTRTLIAMAEQRDTTRQASAQSLKAAKDGLDASAPLLQAAGSDSEALGAQREEASMNDDSTDVGDTGARSATRWQKFRGFCGRNIGLVFVLFAQMFASIVRNSRPALCSIYHASSC